MINIKYGADNQVGKAQASFPTIKSIIDSDVLADFFGWGDNLEVVLVGNGTMDPSAATVDGATYEVVTKTNGKG